MKPTERCAFYPPVTKTKSVKSILRSISGSRRRRRASDSGAECDGGFTVIEATTAGFILAIAIAAGTASLIAASNTRAAATERLLAAEIANEVMQTSEAYGCGLPIGYNGVTAATRLARCDYDPADTSEGEALADADFTLERGGFTFEVQVRMRWDYLDQVSSTYRTTLGACFRKWGWATGWNVTPARGYDLRPELLTRTVIVATERAGEVELSSSQTVDPDLAAPHDSHEMIYNNAGTYKDSPITLTRTTTTPAASYDYMLHTSEYTCAIFPYLEYHTNISYGLSTLNTTNPTILSVCDDQTGTCWGTTPRDVS